MVDEPVQMTSDLLARCGNDISRGYLESLFAHKREATSRLWFPELPDIRLFSNVVTTTSSQDERQEMSTVNPGPLPTKQIFLHEIAKQPTGSKVRFLGW
jgi:Telomere capping, CST complex subunit